MGEAETATRLSQHHRGASLHGLGSNAIERGLGIRPVTVRQLREATQAHSGAPFKIAGEEVDFVTTVAYVLHIRPLDKAVHLTIEDGTRNGTLTAHRWLDSQPRINLPTDGKPFYARIIGKLKAGSEKKYPHVLEISLLKLVDDPHELLFHLLETAFVTLSIERGPPLDSVKPNVEPRGQHGGIQEEIPVATAPNTPAAVRTLARADTLMRPASPVASPSIPSTPSRSTPSRDVATPSVAHQNSSRPEPPRTPTISPPTSPTPSRWTPASGGTPGRASGLRRDPYAQLSVLERAILLQILNAPASEGGVNFRTITRGVSHHNATFKGISDAFDALTEQGYISQSPDGEHYAIRTKHYPST
ncbi:hypothetical protein C8Q73DRAFT_677698 [Cubamyces lactineus]|nr:hypothetical protein C8Q73DRAFT_677698 [Cubamyces lactineus]